MRTIRRETLGLPLDVASLRRSLNAGASFSFRFFWGHRARTDGTPGDAVFSQWWPCSFEASGQHYTSAEHFTMAQKARLFGDEQSFESILAARSPAEAKALGRRVSGFDESVWAHHRFNIVTAGNVAKFGQNPALLQHLLGTNQELLVEASPDDRIWGIGLRATDPGANEPSAWQGLNLLGFALVRAREILRATPNLAQ